MNNNEPQPVGEKYELNFMAEAIHYNRYIFSHYKPYLKPNSTVLDFGAGIGTFSSIMRNQGHHVYCTEIEPSSVTALKKDHFQITELDEIPDTSLDGIFTANVLEHIEDDKMILKQFHQKLKPGGYAYIYVPACPILFSAWDKKEGHYRRYTKQALKSKASQAGLNIVQSNYCDSLGFFITYLMKLLSLSASIPSRRNILIYDQWLLPISKIMDVFARPFFGKNVYIIAQKPS